MPIYLSQFGGMVPKLDGRSLPIQGAQEANNVNIVNGKLAPINVPGPFQVLHDPDTGKMKSMIPDGNIISIEEPDTPVISERIKLLRPAPPGEPLGDGFSWLFNVGMWITYFDENDVFQTDTVSPTWATNGEWEHTEDGIIWRGYLNSKSFTAEPGIFYNVHGPKFKLSFSEDTKYYGGPDQDYSFPDGNLSRTSPDWPQFSMPLTAPIDYSEYDNDGDKVYTGERYTYGHLSLVSVNGPVTELTVDATTNESSTSVELTEAGYVEFHFKANYQRNSQVFVNYTRTLFDQRVSEGYANQNYPVGVLITQFDMKGIRYGETNIPAAGKIRLENLLGYFEDIDYSSYGIVNDVYQFTVSAIPTASYKEDDPVAVIDTTIVGKEGPASELSELSAIDPGDLTNLTVALPDGYYRQAIYRSSTDSNFRLLVDELEDGTYIDTFIKNLTIPLPPYGNYPHDTLAEATEGSIVIGGHTAMIFDGYDVRPSEPYSEWIYPEEYAFPLEAPFLAAVRFGSTAVVFTQENPITGDVGRVYAVYGQNPGYLNHREISRDKPLLNKRSLCMIDSAAYYATTDGLCAVTPGGISLLTEGLFTREQWLELRPEFMSAYTADNSIFVISVAPKDRINFRFDLGEGGGISSFSTFDAFSDADMYWKSKIFPHPRPMTYRNIQVIADGYPVCLTLIGDCGKTKKQILVPSDKAKMLPRMHQARDWEIEIAGRSTVSRVSIGNNAQELNTDG